MITNKIKVILLMLGVVITLMPPADPDFGWHYKMGEYITENRTIPKTNLYSHTFKNYKWIDSYWASQVIFYLLYSNLGDLVSGLILSLLLCSFALYVINKLDLQKNGKIVAYLIFIAIISRVPYVAGRPMLFSTIFMLALYLLLLKRKNLYLIPFIFLIWANMHADFVVGLGILFLATGYEFIKQFYPNILSFINQKLDRYTSLFNRLNLPDYKYENSANPGKYFSVTVLSVLVTVLTPNGIDLWHTLLAEANPVQFDIISEWTPFGYEQNLVGKDIGPMVMLALTGIFLSSVIITVGKFPLWLLLLVLGLFTVTMRSKYFFRILGVFSFYPTVLLFEQLVTCLRGVSFKANVKRFAKFTAYITGTLLTAVFAVNFLKMVLFSLSAEKWAEEYKYPYQAVLKIKELQPKGNMFNKYDWGGFLIMRLPEYKTYIDGRMASWSRDEKYILETYFKLATEPEKNRKLLDTVITEQNIGFVLDKKGSKLSAELLGTEEWEEIYSDDISVLIVNKAINAELVN